MADFKVRFITESGFVSWAIRRATNCVFSHVEIETPSGTFLGAHLHGGVQDRPSDYCKPTFERRYSIPVTDEQYARGMAFARSKIGTNYNSLDILGLLFHAPLTSPHALICSQFVFETFIEMGMKPLNVLLSYSFEVTPDILHLSPIFIGRCYLQTAVPK